MIIRAESGWEVAIKSNRGNSNRKNRNIQMIPIIAWHLSDTNTRIPASPISVGGYIEESEILHYQLNGCKNIDKDTGIVM